MNDATIQINDHEWRQRFITRLRLADVPGARIGDALKTVESHCAESGETAYDAFGDPDEYAASLGFEPRSALRSVLWAVPAFLAVFLSIVGAVAAIRGEVVEFTAWHVGSWVLMLLVLCAISVLLQKPSRLWLVAGLVFVTALAMGLAMSLDAAPLLDVNGWVIAVVGVTLGVVTTVALARDVRADRVADPLDGSDMARRAGSSGPRWMPAVVLVLIIGVLILASLAW